MHFALEVFEDSRDTQQFYYGTVYIAICFSLGMAGTYAVVSFFTFFKVQSTRSVNSATIISLLGQNPFKF